MNERKQEKICYEAADAADAAVDFTVALCRIAE